MASHITSTPIASRPDEAKPMLRSIVFNSLFLLSMVVLHSTQLAILPLALVKWKGLDRYFWQVNERIKKCFAIVLVSITQVFGPTKIVLTAGEGVSLDKLVKRDPKTKQVTYLDLPRRSVTMANHQMYADWLYIWCLDYYANLHGSIIIILKASLKWVPIVGPAMQMFRFIFLARSWSSDKAALSHHLAKLGAEAVEPADPSASSASKVVGQAEGGVQVKGKEALNLLIFPEGTLVSPLTRPISQAFAKKQGIADMKYQLLPRSTGLLFCMRALRLRVPDLALVDLTIGYEGIPPDGYGQDYYTLQSIFGHGHAPPRVHMHVRILPPNSIPLGSTSPSLPLDPSAPTPSASDTVAASDPTPEEAKVFDEWVRRRWEEKDALLDYFYKHGEFPSSEGGGAGETVEVKVKGLADVVFLATMCVPGLVVIRTGWAVFKRVVFG